MHTDTTMVPVLNPASDAPARPGLRPTCATTGRSSVPTRRTGSPPHPDRKGERPRAHPADFQGILQADRYAGFTELCDDEGVVEAACMAHARRRLLDMHAAIQSYLAQQSLNRVAALYPSSATFAAVRKRSACACGRLGRLR